MRRAIHVVARSDLRLSEVKGTVTLPFEDRFRRRVRMADDAGGEFLLDLAQATRLNDGDGLALNEGGVLLVRAAIEDVLEIAAHDSIHAARLAWHIGNRHTALEVLSDGRLRIAYDHVLEHMLEGLGAVCTRAKAPFAPESGAYDNQGSEGHGHAHSHHG